MSHNAWVLVLRFDQSGNDLATGQPGSRNNAAGRYGTNIGIGDSFLWLMVSWVIYSDSFLPIKVEQSYRPSQASSHDTSRVAPPRVSTPDSIFKFFYKAIVGVDFVGVIYHKVAFDESETSIYVRLSDCINRINRNQNRKWNQFRKLYRKWNRNRRFPPPRMCHQLWNFRLMVILWSMSHTLNQTQHNPLIWTVIVPNMIPAMIPILFNRKSNRKLNRRRSTNHKYRWARQEYSVTRPSMVSTNQIIGFNIQSDNSSPPPTQISLRAYWTHKIWIKNAHTLEWNWRIKCLYWWDKYRSCYDCLKPRFLKILVQTSFAQLLRPAYALLTVTSSRRF